MNEIIIAPSILSADFSNMGEGVQKCAEWGADWVHCDVMDGMFVKNITFGMPMVSALRMHSQLPFDVHLMILKPERYTGHFADSGADIVTFHHDASDDVMLGLNELKIRGKKCGLALNPDKDLELVKPYLDTIDMLVLMSVYAGFGGQGYIPETTEKIRKAREMIKASGRNIRIQVDGGINTENAYEVIAAGADTLVAGSAIFKAENPSETIRNLRGTK